MPHTKLYDLNGLYVVLLSLLLYLLGCMARSDIELYADPIKTRFEVCDDFYFSAIAFTIWDNIYGPRIMKIWKNENQDKLTGVPDDTLKAVANYTLTGEACRNGKLDGVETKFYCLSDKDIIATAFLFTVNYGSRSDLFSLLFVLPYSELSEWLSRHILLCEKMKAILTNNFIPHVTQLYTMVCHICVDYQCVLFLFIL